MADPFKLSDAPRSGPLAEAAERLERVANVVKDQQLARTRSGARRPESEAFVLSPEEAWSKKYMIQCVGPVCTVRPTAEGALLLPRFVPAPPARTAAVSRAIVPEKAPEIRLNAQARPGVRAAVEPIGLAIGKPVRRRSWFGRLFRP
jgi:hypothetical protein